MKTVKLSLLAVVVATAVSPSAFAGDTVEAATTELAAIQPGMSQAEIDQKIGRFLERTGNSAAAQNYLIAHDYRTTTPQENTAASPVQPTNTLNPITNQAQTDRDNGQDTAIQDAQHAANWASLKADDAQHAITVAQTDIDANKAAIADTRNDVSAVQSDVTNIKGDVAHAQSTADHANANANTALMNGVKLSGAVTENKNNIEQNRSDIADQQQQLDETRKTVAATGDVQTAARYQSMIDARQTAAANAQQEQADAQQSDIEANKDAITDTRNDVSAVQSDVTTIKGDVAHAQSTADHANANANTALMNGVKLSGAVTENKNNIEQNRSDIADQQKLLASNEQKQIVRDNGQDTAIQDAQHAANWASLKADDAQHAITVAQTDIDANKAAIADTRNDVSAVQSDVTNIKGDVAHAQSTADHANANANTALMNGVKLSGAVTENKNNIEQNRSDIADQQKLLASNEQKQIVRDNGQDTAIQDAQHAANWASLKADDAQHAITVAQTDIDANKAAIADTRNDVSAVQSDVTNIKGDVAHAQSTADHANANANTALMNGVKLSGAVTENKNNIEQNRSDIADQQKLLASNEQKQIVRDNGQDTAIQDAQHAANWASLKADDAQHAITVAQTDIDANKAAIADTRNDVSAVQSDVTNIKGDVAHAQSTADHANANANTALMNGVKLSGAVTENKNNIEQNRSDIADQQQQLDETRKIVAATGDVQTAARYQSMIDARQTAAANAQKAQADTQQQQMDDQQKQIDATQKTVSALGDAQTNAHYQEMVNAGLRAQNDANARTAAEQKQKIDTLATNQATQQHIDSVQYGEQIQRLAQDSTQTHEQIDSLTQDVTQTHQQLSNTQKRVADNSQQITTLNNHFSSLKNEVEDNRKEANAGTASAIAIASQPQVKAGDFMMMSAGAGTFNGESAVSVGTSFNAGTHTVIKAGVSADTQSDFGAGVGVGYSF